MLLNVLLIDLLVRFSQIHFDILCDQPNLTDYE